MKKFFGLLLVVLLAGFGSVVVRTVVDTYAEKTSQTEIAIKEKLDSCIDLYPFYASLGEEEKEYYVKLCAGFKDYSESVSLAQSNSKSDIEEVAEWVNDNYRNVVYEQPDYFWVNPNAFTLKEMSRGKRYTLLVDAKYTVPEDELEEKNSIYKSAVNKLVDEASAEEYLFDAVLRVYDSILKTTDYDHKLAEKDESDDVLFSAYGCLVEGKTVCSGYTLAFTSVMQKLGIPCGAEFDAKADDDSLVSGHVWNYCKLGSEYYYFDLTWDDTSFDSDELKQYLDYTHDFFAITSDELAYTHSDLKDNPTAPPCTAVTYNYYINNGLYCGRYSFSAMKEIIDRQSGEEFAVIKFRTPEDRKKAERDLFTRKRFYEIFPNSASVKYIASASGQHLYLFFED